MKVKYSYSLPLPNDSECDEGVSEMRDIIWDSNLTNGSNGFAQIPTPLFVVTTDCKARGQGLES